MKKCEIFKDMILTDYIDGELNKALTGDLENHLLDCSDCRAFLKEVKYNAALPFKNTAPQTAPAELWSSIREGIESENQRTNPISEFIERFKGMFVLPRLVPVFVCFVVMFFVGSVTISTTQMQQVKDKDQGEYLVSLLSPAGSSTGEDSTDSPTAIEHYFL